MTRARVQYVCQQCGRAAPKPLGRCPQCGSWNSMVAEASEPRAAGRGVRRAGAGAVRLGDIQDDGDARVAVPLEEFSRVLGGGIVPGSIVLIGGDPGIGKSTLLLQVALGLADRGAVLYVSGEESVRQIKGRAGRLGGGAADGLYLMAETELGAVLQQIEALQPRLAIVDSIQTMHDPDLEPAAGSITQVRECAARLQALAKQSGVPVFLIGHVTKDGAIAGPRVLEHLVDTVLYLEGDAQHAYRLLRAVKNRFGPTTEVGVFEMSGEGMVEVPNPSEAFLAERVVQAPGSVVGITLEGTRPLLVEIQGLTSPTAFGNPRRTANGVDFNRLLLITAVLTRRLGLRLGDQDVFVNVVGGLQIDEPAADLAIAAALASSVRDRAVPADMAVVGEVGLSGELRAVPQLATRLHEAAKLGFRRVVAPRTPRFDPAPAGLELLAVRSLREALDLLLGEN
ncbi:MAG TPA: DNA repair protein RadA [Anaerolineales bacterium]|nr:DNA repair protein RadA [Anaerolineales bacterium]